MARKSDTMIGFGAALLENGHRTVLFLTGGRYPKALMGMKPIELHTVGRKSGKAYSNMLTAPIVEPGKIVVIASKGGSTDHPDWYKNLTATPDIEITVDGERSAYHARTASPEEKAELWPRAVAAYKGYAGYQKNTDRDIPVVICEPR
jgi:deazaflavin-dependent oxidoreductase (nitroreductase family)